MARPKRPNGAGSVYIKHGAYYGRWLTVEGGLANRKLGHVREKRLRELMETIQVTSDPDRTVAVAGEALLAQLEARGCSKSHIEIAAPGRVVRRGKGSQRGTTRAGALFRAVPGVRGLPARPFAG